MSGTAERALDLVVPGDLRTATGGYVYDRRILEGLGRLGWRTAAHSLDASFPRPSPAALRGAREVLASLPDGRLVVMDGLALGGLARALAAQAARLDLVALVHHPLALETGLDPAAARLLHAAERDSLAAVRGVIVTSEWTARALGDYGVPRGRVRVVPPGVDPVGTAQRLRPPRGRAGVHLLCVATVTPRKGYDVLLDALALLREKPWHLTCAGSLVRDRDYAERVRRQIARLRLQSRVSLLGEVAGDALERCYRRADVFVLASHMEGYGMALADAVARGLPVVSTTAGAIPHTVPAGTAVLVPPGDHRALAEALEGLLDDAALRRRLAAKAAAAGAALPTWEQSAERFAAAVLELGNRAA